MGNIYCKNSIHNKKMINTLRMVHALYVIELIKASVPDWILITSMAEKVDISLW